MDALYPAVSGMDRRREGFGVLVADAIEGTGIVGCWLVGYPQDGANQRADVLSAFSAISALFSR